MELKSMDLFVQMMSMPHFSVANLPILVLRKGGKLPDSTKVFKGSFGDYLVLEITC
jgi:hypothetical protein